MISLPTQVKEVMLLEEEKETVREGQKGSQPKRTAKEILKLRDQPPSQKEAAWRLMERRPRQQMDWLPARVRQQNGGHMAPAPSHRQYSASCSGIGHNAAGSPSCSSHAAPAGHCWQNLHGLSRHLQNAAIQQRQQQAQDNPGTLLDRKA